MEAGSFARAAEICHVSQPAVSASIAHLEAELGVPLFERGAFGARPTLYGRHLYDRAKLMLSEHRRAKEELTALRAGESGSVAIGIGPLFEHTVVPGVLASFVAQRPRVSISTVVGLTAELFEQLARGELDFSVSTPPGWIEATPSIEVEVLHRSNDVVIAAANHALWHNDDYSLSELRRYPWVVSARIGEAARAFFTGFQEAGADAPRTVVRTDSIPLLLDLVANQGFLCVVSPHIAHSSFMRDRDRTRLRVLPGNLFSFSRQVCLATRAGAPLTQASSELLRLVRTACVSQFSVDARMS